jgi:ABC-type glycerol-3-phosphate transport system substrate-binding protein
MRNVRLVIVIGVVAVLTFLLPPPSRSQNNPDPKLIEAANKEGALMHYTTMTLEQSKEVVDRFQKKYPGIKANLFRTGSGPLTNKILTEARSGSYAWDVAVGGAEMVLPLMARKLIASYRSPETKMFDVFSAIDCTKKPGDS